MVCAPWRWLTFVAVCRFSASREKGPADVREEKSHLRLRHGLHHQRHAHRRQSDAAQRHGVKRPHGRKRASGPAPRDRPVCQLFLSLDSRATADGSPAAVAFKVARTPPPTGHLRFFYKQKTWTFGAFPDRGHALSTGCDICPYDGTLVRCSETFLLLLAANASSACSSSVCDDHTDVHVDTDHDRPSLGGNARWSARTEMMLLERKNQMEREHVMAMARAYVGHVSCTRREMGSRAIPTLQLRAGWGRGGGTR